MRAIFFFPFFFLFLSRLFRFLNDGAPEPINKIVGNVTLVLRKMMVFYTRTHGFARQIALFSSLKIPW